MFKTLRKTIVAAVAAFALMVIPLAVPASVSAANQIENCLSGGATLSLGDNAGSNCPAGTNNVGTQRVNNIITTIVNIFSAIVGVIAVIMIVYGGFKYITSGGDSGNVSSAKNTIIYAVIGLVVVALAQFIVQFVLDKVIEQ